MKATLAFRSLCFSSVRSVQLSRIQDTRHSSSPSQFLALYPLPRSILALSPPLAQFRLHIGTLLWWGTRGAVRCHFR